MLRVMFSVKDVKHARNPYIRLLAEQLQITGVEVFSYSSDRLRAGDIDILHVHWPEHLVAGRSRLDTLRLCFRLIKLLRFMKRAGIQIVQTVHNVKPHERLHPIVDFTLRLFDRQVAARVFMTTSLYDKSSTGDLDVVIPHADYLPLAGSPGTSPAEPWILFFGLIRPYKNVPNLLEAFAGLTDPRAKLRILGEALDPHLALAIREQADDDDRVRIDLIAPDDDQLTQEIQRHRIVVLPYAELTNSGAALLALSCGRPILMPRTDATSELHQELGSSWVHLYDPPLHAQHLATALSTKPPGDLTPPFIGRSWLEVGKAHIEFYASVAGTQA